MSSEHFWDLSKFSTEEVKVKIKELRQYLREGHPIVFEDLKIFEQELADRIDENEN